MIAKFINESMFEGPSEGQVLRRLEGMMPSQIIALSKRNNFIEGLLLGIEKSKGIDGLHLDIPYEKFNDEQARKLVNILKKNDAYVELVKAGYEFNMPSLIDRYIVGAKEKLEKGIVSTTSIIHFSESEYKKYPKLLILAIKLSGKSPDYSVDYSKFSKEEIEEIRPFVIKYFEPRDILKFAIQTNDYELIKEYKDKIFPDEYKNISARELRKYLTPKLQFPQGFMLYKLLKFVHENGPVRYIDIVKHIVELKFGKGKYTSEQRGYYSVAIQNAYSNYLDKTEDGYVLTDLGKNKLKKLKQKLSKKYPKLIR